MHTTVDLKVLYFGTPVALLSSCNPGGSPRGYRFEPDKLGAADLTAQDSEVVSPPRVRECPVQLEGRIRAAHSFGEDDHAVAFEVDVLRVHVADGRGGRLTPPAGGYPDGS